MNHVIAKEELDNLKLRISPTPVRMSDGSIRMMNHAKDKQILQMRAEGYTNQEIADRLGYKTHSAVVKRIKKLGKMYQEYSGLNFGF